jgi:hypothetical protein
MALDQVAIYIWLLRQEIERLGGVGDQIVSDRALLINPRNVGLTPTLSVQPVSQRLVRIERLLASVPSADVMTASVPEGVSFAPIADTKEPASRRISLLDELVEDVGTSYKPGCLTSCGNAFYCRERAFHAGSPCVVGTGAVRLLPGVENLERAAQLSCGEIPAGAESAAAELLASAGKLYNAVTGTTPAEPNFLTRRLA